MIKVKTPYTKSISSSLTKLLKHIHFVKYEQDNGLKINVIHMHNKLNNKYLSLNNTFVVFYQIKSSD